MSEERLQKTLARAGVASRRKVEDLIREGRVTIDGKVATLGDHADLEKQAVKVDDKRITPMRQAPRYILLHKPAGYMSTVEDPEGRKTVLDILPVRMRRGLKPVGRLDWGTEGLLLLSDDGDFIHKIAHPRFGCTKTYEVKVKGTPEMSQIERLRGGMVIDGKRTLPAVVKPLDEHLGARERKKNSWWTIILSEGRTRQIREMFFRIGHPVSRLRRVAIGSLRDPYLAQGSWRELTEVEVIALFEGTQLKRPRSKHAPKRPLASKPAKGPRRAGDKSGRPHRGKDERGKTIRGKAVRGKSTGGKSTGGKSSRPPRGKSGGGRPGGKR